MPELFLKISKILWPLSYYVNPMKFLHIKGAGLESITPFITGSIVFAILWLPIGILSYKNKIKGLKHITQATKA